MSTSSCLFSLTNLYLYLDFILAGIRFGVRGRGLCFRTLFLITGLTFSILTALFFSVMKPTCTSDASPTTLSYRDSTFPKQQPRHLQSAEVEL